MDRNAFHKLLAFGIERGVSDIHFEVGYPPHYRLHGELLGAIKVPPLSAADTEAIARMILEDRNVQADFTRRFTEIDVSYSLAQRGRFRASIFRQRGSVGIAVLRVFSQRTGASIPARSALTQESVRTMADFQRSAWAILPRTPGGSGCQHFC